MQARLCKVDLGILLMLFFSISGELGEFYVNQAKSGKVGDPSKVVIIIDNFLKLEKCLILK